jgi:hypothetical protein
MISAKTLLEAQLQRLYRADMFSRVFPGSEIEPHSTRFHRHLHSRKTPCSTSVDEYLGDCGYGHYVPLKKGGVTYVHYIKKGASS